MKHICILHFDEEDKYISDNYYFNNVLNLNSYDTVY